MAAVCEWEDRRLEIRDWGRAVAWEERFGQPQQATAGK
jgi:hypothetical protein